jgi:ketosteroid isomerase-like protein
MSEENVEIVRSVYEHFSATQVDASGAHTGRAPDRDRRTQAELLAEIETLDLGMFAPSVIVDMANFEIWPEHRLYEGHAGLKEFLRSWLEPWDTYEHHLESVLDAGEEVVAILHVTGVASGAAVEATFGHVWAVIDGAILRVTMYSEPAKALEAAGLSE